MTETPSQLMSRLLRGLPEPEPTDTAQDSEPQSGRDWFDRAVRGRQQDDEPGDAA